jgi:hypothetical protein
MHIALISYHPATSLTDPEVYSDFQHVCQSAIALHQHRGQTYWLSSTETAEALATDTRLAAADAHDVPATCRYVVPYQPYRLAGVPLLGVDSPVWQRPDLHTRLFTLLGLLQRQRPCAVFHAWGTLPTLYLTVYTASFLGIPAVVSYGPLCYHASAQHPFLWSWVMQHAAGVIVASDADRQRLLAMGELPAGRIQIVDYAAPRMAQTLSALYGGVISR